MSAPTPRPWTELQAVMPALGPSELAALRTSIAESGVTYPVQILPDGRIIDGHNRWQIAGAAAPVRVVDLPEADAYALGLALNLARRHLTGEALADLHDTLRRDRETRKAVALAALSQGADQTSVALLVGVGQSTISRWKVEREERGVGTIQTDNGDTPPDHRRTATTPADDQEIAARREQGETVSAIARDKDINRDTVRQAAARAEREPKPKKTARPTRPASAVVPIPDGNDAARWHYATTSVRELLKGIRDEGGLARLATRWTPAQRERQAAALDQLIDGLTQYRNEIFESAAANVVAFAPRQEAGVARGTTEEEE